MSGIHQSVVSTFISTAPSIGDAYEGGFYAGDIVVSGVTYRLVVSPKSTGENSSKQWKTVRTAGPAATQTLNNGSDASSSMNSASYPAAEFCEGLTIGGFSDWYLPARDELEVCYRNLKPTSTSNRTDSRLKSSYTYPEGDDVAGDTMGRNRNSSPSGAAYTTGNPPQTSISAFQSGGAQEFINDAYWSSSEVSSGEAWIQNFNNALQFDGAKNSNYAVRAIRRVAV